MTITMIPHRTRTFGRFASLRSAARELAESFPIRRPEPQPTVNAGRWATLPGEYVGPWARPVDQTLPVITAPGTTAPIACGNHDPIILHLAGTWAGGVAFEGSNDGAIWAPLALSSLDGDADSTETDQPGLWRTLPAQHIAFVRLRVTWLTTGIIHATIATTPAISHPAQNRLDSAA